MSKVQKTAKETWHLLPDAKPAIISKDLFERAQVAMAKSRLLHCGKSKHEYPLTGFAVCGLNLNSLLVLLPRWAGPGWHKLKRCKLRGYWCYTITPKGYYWFQRWAWMMPLKKWKAEIEVWQSKNSPK